MQPFALHITRKLLAAGLLMLIASTGWSQSIPGTRIDNAGVLRYGYADGSRDSMASVTVTSVVEAGSYRLTLTKTATRDTLAPGDIFAYTLRVLNTGSDSLTDVVLVDTLDLGRLELLSAAPASVSGPVVRHRIGSLQAGSSDSILVIVRVKTDVPDGVEVSNTAHAVTRETGSSDIRAHAVVAVRVGSGGSGTNPRLTIEKTVSRDSVEAGGLATYTIHFRNDGDVTLTNVMVADTLPAAVDPVIVSHRGQLAGRVVRSVLGSVGSFDIGEHDSIIVTIRLQPDRPSGELVHNVAWGSSDQTPIVADTAFFVSRGPLATAACRVSVSALPGLVIGNGIAATVLRVSVTDTLGRPKPDGTPVILRTSAGLFSNGLDSIVVPVVGGIAVDSLRAVIVSNSIVTARATFIVDDAGVCSDSASVEIVFYPGAITGLVVDNDSNLPEAGAVVRVYSSSGVLVGATTTGADGTYLIPVPQTDTYEVRIQTSDGFGLPMNTVTSVDVLVPGVGGHPPIQNTTVISGKIFYLVSQKPVAAAGIKVVLSQAPGGGVASEGSFRSGRQMVDSTFTDSTGSYSFSGLSAGNTYAVSIDDAFLRGSVAVAPVEPGTYVTDVNIPITLNPTLELSKTGPSRAYRRDTVSYVLQVRNRGTLSTTGSVLIDSLDRSMRFVSSVPAPSSIDTVHGTLRWSLGRLDSAASPASLQSVTLLVRFDDTTSVDRRLTNTLRFVSEQTTDTSVAAVTDLFETDLVVTKTTARSIVEVGDQSVYSVTIRNATPAMTVRNVFLEDRPPVGFTYLAGSAFRDTARMSDPTIVRSGSGVVLRWSIADSLPAGASRSLSYRLIVGAGASEGDGTNRAMATASAPNGVPLRSSEAQARVEVQRGVFTDRGLVIGKVFYDPNRNSHQDAGESGQKGVELITEDGTRIVTGDGGKYSIPDVAPGEHVIRVRRHSLPAGVTLHAGFNDFAGDATSRFVNVPSGGIARADFYLDRPPVEDSLLLTQRYVPVGGLSIGRSVSPKNVAFIDDERPALMKLSGLNFEVGKAILRPEAFPLIRQLADILRDLPDESVTISGHTDASPIRTAEFPNNRVLSIARAEAVKAHLVDHEGIDLRRIMTSGFGESRPVADNRSREGRALNRRVEFGFGPAGDQGRRRDSATIMVTIPMHVNGASPLLGVEWTDSLGEGLRYVSGSGVFRGRSIEPVVRGSKLDWSVDSLPSSFDGALVYQVAIGRPAERLVSVTSSTGALRLRTTDGSLASDEMLVTRNQASVAAAGRAVNFVMPGVLFETAQAELRPGTANALEAIASMLLQDPSLSLIVEGHTDPTPIRTGRFASNLELSKARAASIVDVLAAQYGIARSRMTSVGYGEHRPMTTDQSAEGRQMNRRVELRLFREEYSTSVLKEGGVDSTKGTFVTVMPSSAAPAESTVVMKRGERYLAVFDAVWSGSGHRSGFVALVDTLPSWMRVDHATIRSSGLESISIHSPLFGQGNIASPRYRVSFEFVVDESFTTVRSEPRRFHVVRRSSGGPDVVIVSPPVLITPAR